MSHNSKPNSKDATPASGANHSNSKNNDKGNNNNRGKKRPPPTQQERLSRALSWALRHQGPQIGLSVTPDGYVPVAQILACDHPKFRQLNFTLQDIQDLVKSNDKQRFHLDDRPISNYPGFDKKLKLTISKDDDKMSNGDNNAQLLCIRASQGHSIKFIDSELLLTPIPQDELAQIPVIVHGTYQIPWKTIRQKGLYKMSRNHIHFASGLPNGKDQVISGMRKSSEIYIYIDAAKCANDHPSIVFYKSANGVLLTAGVNGNGSLPVEYFSHVTDSQGNVLLDQRGKAGSDDADPKSTTPKSTTPNDNDES